MNKTWIIPLAVLMVVPALGAATPIVQTVAVPERLVEGHTVFTVIEQVNATTANKNEFAAAVAVLVREATANTVSERFPGVLWFNDQYLVDPVDNSNNNVNIRYPCTGSVAGDNQGDFLTNPVDPGTPGVPGSHGANSQFSAYVAGVPGVGSPGYVESYLITDPNDHQWNVDKWDVTGGAGTLPLWTVAMEDNQAGYDTPDDGVSNCAPYVEATQQTPVSCGAGDGNVALGIPPGQNPGHCDANPSNPTAVGIGGSGSPDYPTTGTTCDPTTILGQNLGNSCDLKYNAVLFFYLGDLTVGAGDLLHCSSQVDYTPRPAACPPVAPDGTATGADVSGCQAGTNPIFADQWPCPGNDDNKEGNSHPYNPFNGLPVCPNCVGRDNHGGSGGTTPGDPTYAGADQVNSAATGHSHATRMVDLWYGNNPAPNPRAYRVVDTEGSLAPFYCEDGFTLCVPGDL